MSARSLRHYEDEGLIVPGRCSNGYRDYCPSTIDSVVAIRSLLQSGLPLRLIKRVLQPADGAGARPDTASAEVLREVRSYRDQLAARIVELTAQRSALDAYLADVGNGDRHLA